MALCLCRGHQWGRRASDMGHLWAFSSAHVLSREPCWCPAPLHPLVLSCSPAWQWFRDGTSLPDGRSTYIVSNKERTLTLQNASPDDNGLYYCCARSAVGSICSQNNFTLNIIGELCPGCSGLGAQLFYCFAEGPPSAAGWESGCRGSVRLVWFYICESSFQRQAWHTWLCLNLTLSAGVNLPLHLSGADVWSM